MADRPRSARTRVRILIVDDHPVVRLGMRQLIASEPDLEVCGEAPSAAEALEFLERTKVDVAVVDLSLKGSSGVDLIKQIKALHPSVKILVSSVHDETLFADRVFRAGALGYVSKQEASGKIVEAIRRVVNGKPFLSERMTERLLQNVANQKEGARLPEVSGLSDRELEVFELIGRGVSTREIAEQLNLSAKTIETHRENIKTKLVLGSNSELVRRAVEWVLRQA